MLLVLVYVGGEWWLLGFGVCEWLWFVWLVVLVFIGLFGLWFVVLCCGGVIYVSGWLFLVLLFVVLLLVVVLYMVLLLL